MDAVTYPDNRAALFVQDRVIPVRVRSNAPLASEYNVHWTPTLVLVDAEGREHHRTVGWLGPDDLIANLILGAAKAALDRRELDKAIASFGEALDRYPQSEIAPEALYLSGVARFKQTRDLTAMRSVYEKLRASHPSSEWTRRASVYESA